MKKWREKHKNEIKEYMKKWYEEHKSEKKEKMKELNLNIRMQIQNIYGNKCARCGETDPNVLSINHILQPSNPVYNGLKRAGVSLYRQLLERPDIHQYFNLHSNI